MIYAANEKKPKFEYLGTDPCLQGSAESFEQLIECLRRAGQKANLAEQSLAERECLVQGCQQGWGLDAAALGQRLQDRIGGGNEHDVFFDVESQRVIKVTQSSVSYGAQGTAYAYLTNLSRCNRMFADAIRFEGMVLREEGGYALVISQPFVQGEKASEDEISAFFGELGFHSAGTHAFQLTGLDGRDYFIADARPDNVIRADSTGVICPIDVQVIVSVTTSDRRLVDGPYSL